MKKTVAILAILVMLFTAAAFAEETTAPTFTGGSLRGTPSLMILSAGLAGWRPGETLELDWNGRACTGIILARSVEADTASGPWKSEMIVELIP